MKSNLMKVLMILAIAVVLGMAAFIYLFIDAHDYAVPLGNGYRYFGAKDNLTVIDRGCMSEAERERVHDKWNEDFSKQIEYDIDDIGAPRVGPNVDRYCVYPGIITGHVSKPQSERVEINHPDPHSKKLMTPGYFIINTRVNRIYRGLNKYDWKMQLKKYKINREPRLFRPSKSDVRLGHNKPQPLPN